MADFLCFTLVACVAFDKNYRRKFMENVLLVLITVLMTLLVYLQIVMMIRISRVEKTILSIRSIKPDENLSMMSSRSSTQEKPHGQGLFDQFLAEDPQRKLLTKRESSEAFRVWRKEHGMTWQKSETEDDAEA